MNLSTQAMRPLQSDSARTNRAWRFAAEPRNQACADLRKLPRQHGDLWARLSVLAAMALAITCGIARAQSLVATIPSGPSPVEVAVNQTTNMVYVADNNIATLLVINGATNTAAAIPAGGPLAGVAVNPTTNTIYALNGGSSANHGSVAVINGATNAITTTIALPGVATFIVVNPVTNHIYVSTLNGPVGNGVTSSVVAIDGSTNSITATVAMPALISHIDVDTVKNVTYALYYPVAGNFNQSTLAAISGATNTVTATVAVGINDTSFALDTTTNTIYVPDTHFNQIYVVDGATDTVTTQVAIPGGLLLNNSPMAVNPVTDEIYATTAYSASAGTAFVQVLNGSTNAPGAQIAEPTVGGTPTIGGALLANPVTDKIWQISSPVVVIDGAANTATAVTGTSGLQISSTLGALNTTTNYAYLAGANNVFVISGAAAGPAFSASPSPLAFGNQTQGTTSSAMTLTVTNTGTTNLTITTVTPGGANKADFIVGTDTCSDATVAAGKTCTVSVEFDPSTASSESATLTFADNASDSPETVTLTGTGTAPVPTSTTSVLTASATSVAEGASVTFTSTVTPTAGTPTPTGTVTFMDGATTLGTGTLNGSGVATYSTSSLALASHSITAVYAGDTRNLGSTSNALTVNVTTGSTKTALTASSDSIVVGSSVTFTATVTGASGVPAPTGTVTFVDGTTSLGTGTLNGSGVATYSSSTLAAGSHSVTASYAGDANNASSVSSAVAVSVWSGPAAYTVTLSPSSGSFAAGTPAMITVTVTSVNGFNSAAGLACGTLPQNTTCTFSSTSITPTVSGTATSTLTIATDVKADSATLRSENSRSTPARSPFQGPIAIAGGLAAFLMFPLFGRRNRKVRRLLLAASSAILFAVIALSGISGCGGSGPKTPKGTYPIQVTVTAGSLTQTATFSLTVQ